MLTKEFLAPYYARGDNFPNLLARCTYRSKYSRNGGTEVWTDTIRRVVEANCALDPTTTVRECELLFHVFWTMQALPPGRGLWVGGIDSIPADARYNCFSKETKFFANRRLVSFEDVLGETVQVRCVDGEWRPAEVKSFGVQRLFRFVLKAPGRSNFKLEYTATENHRWITNNRGMVTDLKVGDTVRVIPDKIDENSKAFKDGFIHGIVFGDGSALGEGVYQTRLCGDKAKHLDAMREYGGFISSSNPPSYNGDPIVRVCCSTTDLKGLPLESATFEYQAGFLAGWLATDGSFRKDGRGGNRLSSINHEALNWVTERAPFLGYCVTGDLIDLSEETNFGKRSGLVRVLTLTTESVLYTVSQKIDEGREEEVFCVTEPETHTFTIEGGIRTGQCWYTTVYDIDDWGWVANQLMLGGGVGVGLEKIHNLPTVAKNDSLLHITCRPDHPNITEVAPDPFLIPHSRLVVADSREGWVGGLITALHGAFTGTNTFFDVSPVRERGAPIKTFGGTACGPGPLVDLLRSVWNVVRGAAGRKLTSVEALDITNYIGRCIKAGNVRRSALIALGGMDDQPFRDAKKDWEKVASHRHTSNNSINFHQFDQFTNFDWVGLVNDNIEFGEPGLNNLALGRMYDPELEGINPCGEQQLHNRESCNLAEIFPALFDGSVSAEQIFKLVTRYTLRQRLTPLTDPLAEEQRRKNMRIGVGLGGICDFDWTEEQLHDWYRIVCDEANSYADELGVARPITKTTVKPSGTISLLNGSDPGLHAPEAPFYVRRMRISLQEPMAQALAEANVPFEPDIYDNTGNTMVFSFPMRARNQKISALTQTLEEQFERQLAVQKAWADNAVSCTIKFDKDEAGDMARMLGHYAPQLKSVSMLPKAHGYKQAPYEPITEDEYVRLAASIDHTATLAPGDMEIEECAGGACPIR